ncbi:hypothetical protein TL16_g11292 [Triparma laevis f. inornata]|uniref:Phosphatidate phosphatase APP1 catalytic domain-containing protein n=1 Tax=Triparma laevis f. inornata TaxID=1714386 RepID=A0A9W7BD86_9STRA|nr:hypothetical protein TL16_g11292 [Triparma laevis f. inornata]
MDRSFIMMLMLLSSILLILLFLSFFARAPIFSSLLSALIYTLYLFIANEKAGVHNAQEFENRFWTVFALMFATAVFFAKDSPFAFGLWSPSLGFLGVCSFGYAIHAYDRYLHRKEIGRVPNIRRSSSIGGVLKFSGSIPVEEQLNNINKYLAGIDQIIIPSTINNLINIGYIMEKEREIISVLQEAEPSALNFLVTRVKLALLFYKIKDHRNISGQHRTELIDLLAVNRISELNIVSRATVLDALQMMKMTANSRCEFWVKNLICKTKQDSLSELKTLTDAKGDYFSMHKLIYDDLRSERVREDILKHMKDQANVQEAHMRMKTKKSRLRLGKAWRKILSDVDDTMLCSGGHYPAGIDKRFAKKVLYPGVLAFYRELDLGTRGPETWPEGSVGNLVFLSARPHMYKDVSEKANYAKFAKLRERGMHTNPSLLAGDMKSGSEYMMYADMEPLAVKKFQNFKEYVSIYPEFSHVFIGDNGQGDVRGGELMHDAYPGKLEMLYVHMVQPLSKTHGWDPERYRQKGLNVCFFRTYVEAGIDAAKRGLIRKTGLRRICLDAVKDFQSIGKKQWPSKNAMHSRRAELNHSLSLANLYLVQNNIKPVPMILSSPQYNINERVSTTYGNGWIRSFDPVADLYRIELDWRGLDVQIKEFTKDKDDVASVGSGQLDASAIKSEPGSNLETVSETHQKKENLDSSKDSKEPKEADDSRITSSSLRSHSSPPSSIMPDPETASSFGDNSELAFYRNVTDAANEERHLKTFLDNEASKASPVTSNFADRLSPQFSPLSATTTPLRSGSVNLPPLPHLSLEPTAYEAAVSVSSSTTNWKSYGKEMPLAWCKARDIKPFELPVLYDETERPQRGIFSFFSNSSNSNSNPSKTVKIERNESDIKAGSYVNTFCGEGKVLGVRDDNIVVLNMSTWGAKAYIRIEDCEIVVKESWLWRGRGKLEKPTSEPIEEEEYIFAMGEEIDTPYGAGKVVDIRIVEEKEEPTPQPENTNAVVVKIEEGVEPPPPVPSANVVASVMKTTTTLQIELKFGNLYCAQTSASAWKKKFNKNNQSGILSVIGSVFRRMTVAPPKAKKKEEEVKTYSQFFTDSAQVQAGVFGQGTVLSHRESDDMYAVQLNYGVGYFHRSALRKFVAFGCEDMPCGVVVDVGLSGLTGRLVTVDEATSVHKVEVGTSDLTCYLNPKAILKPIKVVEGDDVFTHWGEGVVQRYRQSDGMFEVKLSWGATVYSLEADIEKEKDREKVKGLGGWISSWFVRAPPPEPSRRRTRTLSIDKAAYAAGANKK